ncbi:MAG: class I SAM-dependent methyltransferase [Gemmataceae bacterium]
MSLPSALLGPVRRMTTAARHGWGPARLADHAIRRHQAVQRLPELAGLVSMVAALKPTVVVEVGTRHGGTFSCWPPVAAAGALLVSMDLPAGSFGGGSGDPVLARLAEFLRPGQRLETLRQDSHLPASREWLVGVLAGRPIDFLFLDGDHSLAGIRQDFETYGPLVRPGGLVAFHDILPDPGNAHIQVPEFWAELRGRYAAREFIDPPGRTTGGMGIGVVRV